MGIADWVVTIGGISAIPIVTWIVARGSRRATAEQQMIQNLNTRVSDLEDSSRLQSDYIFELREQVADLGGKPKPWPEGLQR